MLSVGEFQPVCPDMQEWSEKWQYWIALFRRRQDQGEGRKLQEVEFGLEPLGKSVRVCLVAGWIQRGVEGNDESCFEVRGCLSSDMMMIGD
jgi:hypothetical protein